MIEVAITTKLATVAQNIYIGAAPEGYSTPCVVFNRFMTNNPSDLTGDDSEYEWYSLQVDTYDPDATASLSLAKLVRRAFVTWSDSTVIACSLKDEAVSIDETTQTPLYRVKQEYLVYAALS